MAIIRSTGYTIVIGSSAFKALSSFYKKSNYEACFILCDSNTLHNCLPVLISACKILATADIIEVEPGEESKSLEFTANILQTLIENKAGRSTLLINLGGGVVSDLGGFAASIYKRGIDFINIPTSLLSMADASVGGKTGIDFSGIKNSVGTFTQPKAVFIDPVFLNTLPERQYKNGLAEVYKIALLRDKIFWHELKENTYDKNKKSFITKSVTLKNEIVIKDLYDNDLRKCLNFGHSIGHAVEALSMASEHPLLHGEAVVIGLITESHIAWQKRHISKQLFLDIERTLTSVFGLSRIDHLAEAELMEFLLQDKKNKAGKIQLSLISAVGKPLLNVEASPSQIKKALHYYRELS